jgi:hypothetical protein
MKCTHPVTYYLRLMGLPAPTCPYVMRRESMNLDRSRDP